jgi:hypothetical protein
MCFLASLLAEAYCVQRLNENIYYILGIGGIVLITGFLLLNTIFAVFKSSSEKTKFLMEKIYQEETEKWNERYTELLNIQKATYSAAKKNTAMAQEQLTHMSEQLEMQEKALHKITELIIKSMEGQKNALKLEVNYNKENTRQLIKALKEETQVLNVNGQMKEILELLESNKPAYHEPAPIRPENMNNTEKTSQASVPKEASEAVDTPVPDSNEDNAKEAETQTIKPLYDDPNKNLTAEEIASLFANFGK